MTLVKPVSVTGLRDVQAALKAVDGEAQKGLRIALNAAADIVRDEARRKVPTRTGRAQASIRSQSSQREARVMGGSKKVPYFAWLDFGGTRVGRGGGKATRPFYKVGRYVWASYDKNRTQIAEVLDLEIRKAIEAAGIEVT